MKETHLRISGVIVGGIAIMIFNTFHHSMLAGFMAMPMLILAILLIFGFPRGDESVAPEERLAMCLFVSLLEGTAFPVLLRITLEMPMLRGIIMLIWLFIGLMVVVNLLIGNDEVVGYSIKTGKGSYLHFRIRDGRQDR